MSTRIENTHDARWRASLEDLTGFLATHGRRPSRVSADREEAVLGLWLQTQRNGAGRLPAWRRELLDLHVPGWDRAREQYRQIAAARVLQLKVHRDAYGAWPSARSRDDSVRRLAGWHSNQRSGAGTAETRELLDREVPGWNESVQETWERTAREIAEFRARVGELPSRSSREPKYAAWARWIDDMRRGRGMNEQRTAFLDETLPGWRIQGRRGVRPKQLAMNL